MIMPGILVCSSFLISMCRFIVSKALLILSAIVIVRAGGAICLNPFTTVLFTVCSAVTVECCVLYSCCVGAFGTFEMAERRDMYEVPLSLLGIEMGTMLANFHMCGIMLVLRLVFNMLVRNASRRGPMCFRCLMFSLSGPWELLFLICFIASWT